MTEPEECKSRTEEKKISECRLPGGQTGTCLPKDVLIRGHKEAQLVVEQQQPLFCGCPDKCTFSQEGKSCQTSACGKGTCTYDASVKFYRCKAMDMCMEQSLKLGD